MRNIILTVLLLTVFCVLTSCDTTNNKKSIATPLYERKLLVAVKYDRLEMAKEALDEGANINELEYLSFKNKGKKETNPLFIALNMAAFDTAEYLIKSGADLNSYRNQDGETYLTFFATQPYSKCKKFIPLLLEHGADPSLTDDDGNTPIEKMLLYSDISDKYLKDLIGQIVRNGYEINEKTIKAAYGYYGCEMLPEMTEKLMKEGKDTGLSRLEENIILGKSDKVKIEISKNSIKDYDKEAIIMLIAAYCDSETLKKGLSVVEKTYSKDSMLIVASRAGNLDNMMYLIGIGADKNYVAKSGQTPLLWAVINNHYDAAEYLINNEVNWLLGQSNMAPEGMTNELCAASMNGNIKMLSLLYKNLGNIDETEVSLSIQTAANYDQKNVIEFFLSKGYTGEVYDTNSQSLLERVIYYQNVSAIKLLINHGADVNGKVINDVDGTGDALENAINYGSIDTVKCLLENGAKPNVMHLITAIYKANLEDIKLLVEHGADVKGTTEEGNPVIFYAAAYSNNILRYLVEHGADVNQCEPMKNTPPLIIAVNNGMVDNAKYLIEAGADTSKRNATGKTAYEFAKESKYQPMIEMFEEMGVTE